MAHHILLHRRKDAIWDLESRETLVDLVLSFGREILQSPNMQSERRYPQHGLTDCFTHSICVAYMSLRVAEVLHIRIDPRSMVRGALLHDYFLYDWHDKAHACRFHTFCHPLVALRNAEAEFTLNPVERDIIRKHMFPLCFPLPRYKESFIISIADKCCAASEIWHLYSLRRIIDALERGMQTWQARWQIDAK